MLDDSVLAGVVRYVVPQSHQQQVIDRNTRRFPCSVCNVAQASDQFTPRRFAWMPIVCLGCDRQMKRENE